MEQVGLFPRRVKEERRGSKVRRREGEVVQSGRQANVLLMSPLLVSYCISPIYT